MPTTNGPDDIARTPEAGAWAKIIRNRAAGKSQLTADRAVAQWVFDRMKKGANGSGLGDVTAVTVGHWLCGFDVPRTQALYDILMLAIDVPPIVEKTAREARRHPPTPAERVRTEMRRTSDARYADALKSLEGMPPVPEQVTASRKGQNGTTGSGGQDTEPMGEHACLKPLRMHQDPYIRYDSEDFETNTGMLLKDIQARTPNVHEFLRVSRLLQGLSIEALADEAGVARTSVQYAEAHAYIPGEDIAKKISDVLFQHRPDLADRLTHLIISNRYLIATHEPRDPDMPDFGAEMIHMPKVYWQAIIEKFLNPTAWNARRGRPSWEASMMPIESRGDYMMVVRNLLGLTQQEMVEALGLGTSNDIVSALESGISHPSGKGWWREHVYPNLEHLQREHVEAGGEEFFDLERVHALPVKPRVVGNGHGGNGATNGHAAAVGNGAATSWAGDRVPPKDDPARRGDGPNRGSSSGS